ncbi:hypothetical protein Psyc_1014 [Psychrobacter arcticus 273-4]|uniref:Uncharacterized protein n=1 Tax=Psychrobacter arcticus (strain DSM 17307 / VKM B-2377 / 273-4) TaxID=259536 RepID=Q4FSZ1_PSYA2|nr:hypothetical protein [Psychrobacter arcticus]AAZ18867.1 hypothetical protein Psyc_1014 [Psychrobacter arcticus 273-4]
MNINHIQIGATNIVKAYLGNTIIYQKVMGLVSLFSASQQGFWYEPADITTLYQDAAGTVATTLAGDPIALVKDKSGNNNHAVQTVSTKRSVYNVNPSRITLDKVDDEFVVTVPTGGWIGTMVVGTAIGTASYEVNLPAGSFLLGQKDAKFDRNIVGVVLRNSSLTEVEKTSTKDYFIGKGAVDSYGAATDFVEFWRNCTEITDFPLINTVNGINFSLTWLSCNKLTSFPLINTSGGTNFYGAWSGCSRLTSFPLINTISGTSFSYAWQDCNGLTSFPLINTSAGTNLSGAWYRCFGLTSFPQIDTSSGTNFYQAWSGCSRLTSFPSNMFDNVKGGDFTYAFTSTALTQVSIDNILTSLVTSGIAAGTRRFDQSGGSAPSITGTTAIDTLRSRGWTVTVTGGY